MPAPGRLFRGDTAKVQLRKEGKVFVVDPVDLPGSPRMGVGNTIEEAFGIFLIAYQSDLRLVIDVHDSAKEAESTRRKTALNPG